MPVDFLGFAYAATVAAGGIFGYVKACKKCVLIICELQNFMKFVITASVPSLAAGLAFGAIIGYGSFLTSQDVPRPLLLCGSSGVLLAIMGNKFMKTGKMMPPGFIAIISGAVLLRTLVVYNRYLPIVGRNNK
jgi:uncharacterized membrane protein (UPF0136 family)